MNDGGCDEPADDACPATYRDCDDPVVEEPEPDQPVEEPVDEPDDLCERKHWRGRPRRRAGVPILRGLVARTWQELFDTGAEAPPPSPAGDGEPERRGFFKRLRENMSKTREAIGAELQTTVFQSLDDEAFERLEETLIYADVGAPTTAKIVERLETGGRQRRPPGRRGAGDAPARAARRDRARGRRHDPAHGAADRDPRDGRERQREDDHDREDGLAPPEGARPLRAARRRRHLPRGRLGAARAVGASEQAARSCAARRARTRRRSSTTRSRPAARAATTW